MDCLPLVRNSDISLQSVRQCALLYGVLFLAAVALRHQYPYIYELGAPAEFLDDGEVKKLMKKKFIRKPKTPVFTDTLVGSKGTEFTSFAKHQSLNDGRCSTGIDFFRRRSVT